MNWIMIVVYLWRSNLRGLSAPAVTAIKFKSEKGCKEAATLIKAQNPSFTGYCVEDK